MIEFLTIFFVSATAIVYLAAWDYRNDSRLRVPMVTPAWRAFRAGVQAAWLWASRCWAKMMGAALRPVASGRQESMLVICGYGQHTGTQDRRHATTAVESDYGDAGSVHP